MRCSPNTNEDSKQMCIVQVIGWVAGCDGKCLEASDNLTPLICICHGTIARKPANSELSKQMVQLVFKDRYCVGIGQYYC